ncbi:MAG: YcbK family protein [Hyphomicrobiales bacterium]
MAFFASVTITESNTFNNGTEWVNGISPPGGLDLPKQVRLVPLPQEKPENFARPRTKKSKFIGLNKRLALMLHQVERHFGQPVRVTSGCRTKLGNRLVGGARKSYHLKCMAADIRVSSVSQIALRQFLKTLPGRGGVGTYCNKSIVHIDVGPRRSWHYGCKKRRYYAKISRKKRVARLRKRK